MAEGQGHARYRIELTSAALRDLKALPKNVLQRVDRRILSLADNPRPRGSEKLKGEENLYRVRVGEYRIIYRVEEEGPLIRVIRIRHRGDVYRGLS